LASTGRSPIRSATLEFYRPKPLPGVGEVVRLDPALTGSCPGGPDLLFSDPNENTIYRWTEDRSDERSPGTI